MPKRSTDFAFAVGLPSLAAAVFLVSMLSAWSQPIEAGHLWEVSLVAYLGALIWSVQRRRITAAGVTLFIVFSLYLLGYGKLYWLGEVPRVGDLMFLGELVYGLPLFERIAVSALPLSVALAFGWNFDRGRWRLALPLAVPAMCGLTLFVVAPARLHSLLDRLRAPAPWDKSYEFVSNGPLFYVLHDLAETREVRRYLALAPRFDFGDAMPRSDEIRRKPNITFIAVEGFIDPTRLVGLSWPMDPIDPRMRAWIDASASLSLSPVFGGSSSRPELEFLCGIPSYGEVGVEFNLMSGREMPCLPSFLRSIGYDTVAIDPVPDGFFNYGKSYRAVGFTTSHLKRDFELYDMDGQWISNEAMFAQGERFMAKRAGGKPRLTYYFTNSGHFPYERNEILRPDVMDDPTWAYRAANTAFYNTRSLVDFVERVERSDPSSIVVIVGDHLPVLGPEFAEYKSGGYRPPDPWSSAGPSFAPATSKLDRALAMRGTMLIVRDGGRVVPLGLVPQYAIPGVLYDLLSDGEYCSHRSCAHRSTLLYRPIGGGILFTTSADYPKARCERGETDGVCAEAGEIHRRWHTRYRGFLRQAATE